MLDRALAIFGLFHLAAMLLGQTDLIDYHLYIGPDATAWHTREAATSGEKP
ncbi:hypothetical protein [Pseudorhodoferax sp. Leaf265]|uniref:hypothetical protein n=1 Tax=Pseudorhodoferax sp. Leaf265 TaxID=1736315 RepID=UPI0012E7409A|nr:hypothetical protein [Pseudorhodoferax sp. Leaf265]